MRNEKCARAFVKKCHKIARKVAGVVIHCAVVCSVAVVHCNKVLRAEFYFVQSLVQQKKTYEATQVTLCNSVATCLTMALGDKLLRKLRSVRGPFKNCKTLTTEYALTHLQQGMVRFS